MTNADALKGRWQPPAKRQTTGGGWNPRTPSSNERQPCIPLSTAPSAVWRPRVAPPIDRRWRRSPSPNRRVQPPSDRGGGNPTQLRNRQPSDRAGEWTPSTDRRSSLPSGGGRLPRTAPSTDRRSTPPPRPPPTAERVRGGNWGGGRLPRTAPLTDRRSTPPPRPPPTERRVGGGNWGGGRFPRTALSTDRRSPPPQRPPSTELSVGGAGGKPTERHNWLPPDGGDGKPAYTERRCPLSSDRGGARIPRTSPPTERRSLPPPRPLSTELRVGGGGRTETGRGKWPPSDRGEGRPPSTETRRPSSSERDGAHIQRTEPSTRRHTSPLQERSTEQRVPPLSDQGGGTSSEIDLPSDLGSSFLRKSCNECRRVKRKCVPSLTSNGPCQRCVEKKRPCLFGASRQGRRNDLQRGAKRRKIISSSDGSQPVTSVPCATSFRESERTSLDTSDGNPKDTLTSVPCSTSLRESERASLDTLVKSSSSKTSDSSSSASSYADPTDYESESSCLSSLDDDSLVGDLLRETESADRPTSSPGESVEKVFSPASSQRPTKLRDASDHRISMNISEVADLPSFVSIEDSYCTGKRLLFEVQSNSNYLRCTTVTNRTEATSACRHAAFLECTQMTPSRISRGSNGLMIAFQDGDLKRWCLGIMSHVALNYDTSDSATHDGYYSVFRWIGPTMSSSNSDGKIGPAVFSRRRWSDCMTHFRNEAIPIHSNLANRKFVYLNQVSLFLVHIYSTFACKIDTPFDTPFGP